jgi:hypothetical protein
VVPGRDEELGEFRALSAKVAADAANEAELLRWRELRNQLAGPPAVPARTPPVTPRAHARVARKIRVLFLPVKSMSVTFTEEVSAGGLRLNVPEMLEVGTALLVRVELAGPGDPEAVTSLARVAWCQRERGHFVAGVELVGLQPHERERLEASAHSGREVAAEAAAPAAPAPPRRVLARAPRRAAAPTPAPPPEPPVVVAPPPSGFFAPPAVPVADAARPAAPPPQPPPAIVAASIPAALPTPPPAPRAWARTLATTPASPRGAAAPPAPPPAAPAAPAAPPAPPAESDSDQLGAEPPTDPDAHPKVRSWE